MTSWSRLRKRILQFSPAAASTALTSEIFRRVRSFGILGGLLVLRGAETARDLVLQHGLPLANDARKGGALSWRQNGEGALPRKLHQRGDGRPFAKSEELGSGRV